MSYDRNLIGYRNAFDVERFNSQPDSAGLVLRLFHQLEQAQIGYCVLRDGDRLLQLPDLQEIDLLVAENQLSHLRAILADLDFAELPGWGHAPHHFFLKYEETTGRWLKLDVVTALSYGRPARVLRTELAGPCLANRRRCGPLFIPAVEDEFMTLLLHCVLDKGRFDLARRQRLQALRHDVTDMSYMSSLLAAYWLPSMGWPQLAALIDGEAWETILAAEHAVVARLRQPDEWGTTARYWRARILQKVNRWAGFWQRNVPMVALLAPDGAGKSTLAEGLASSSYFPVRSIYMGLYQNGDAEKRRPSVPGLGLAGRIVTQWRRYLAARYHQGRGRLVIFDRYTYDSLLSTRQSLDILRRFRRWLLGNACPPPDLVIILDAPGELLYARKGEHTASILEEQRQEYLSLRAQLPQTAVVDATQDSDAVQRQTMALIWRKLRNGNVNGMTQ